MNLNYKEYFLLEKNDSEEAIKKNLIGINQYYYDKKDVTTSNGIRSVKANALPKYVRSSKTGRLEPFNPKVHNAPNSGQKASDKNLSTSPSATDAIEQRSELNKAEINKARLDLFTGKDAFIGTAGSAVGETFGIIGTEQFLTDTMDHFIIGYKSKIDILRKKFLLARGAEKAVIFNYLKKFNMTIDDFSAQEVWIDEQVKMLSQYKKNKNALINKLPIKELRQWLRVAYRTGFNESRALKSNLLANYNKIQSPGYPLGIVVNQSGREQIKKFLETHKQKNLAHYEQQLNILNHLIDTDTAIIYEDNDGNFRVWHISNKKTFDDPHINTYPNTRFELMKSRVDTILGNIPDRRLIADDVINIASAVVKQIKLASEGIVGLGKSHWNAIKNTKDRSLLIEQTASILRYLPGHTISKKRDGIEKILKRSGAIKKYIINYEKTTGKKATDKTYAEAMYKLISGEILTKNGTPERISAEIVGILTKISTLVDSIDEEIQSGNSILKIADKYKLSIPIVKLCADKNNSFKFLRGSGRKFKDAASNIHNVAVKSILERDNKWKQTHPQLLPESSNGPATQLYIDAFLKSMHWYDYIDGDLDGVKSINIGGKSINPKNFRDCIADLASFTGDLNDSQGKTNLKQFLRERVRISSMPGDAHISFDAKDPDGPVIKLGKEMYRAKGHAIPILGYLGNDLIKCLDK